jgi:hypothetical protein
METKNCQKCKNAFIIEPDDFSFYENMKIPTPTFCPLCRAQRRMAWRNESCLFKRKSDFSGKDIFSSFSPEAPVKVYEKEVWLTDQWDPMDYGIDYDYSRTFFEQFKDLLFSVPLKNLNVVNGVNSDYSNNFTDPKNCYLCFNGKGGEDCMYSNGVTHLKNCIDVSNCGKSEICYESFWLTSCSNTIYSSQCENSFSLSFCRDCVGCHDCFGCVGLRKKEYYIFNVKYNKEEYKKKIEELNISSYINLQKILKQSRVFWSKFPKKYIEGYSNTNVDGNYISHSKNVKKSSFIREGENLKFCQYLQELPGSKDCYDHTSWGDASSFTYECTACGININNIKFCFNVQENVHDIEYSYMCSGSAYLFGCVGLRKKQYCIFNKQYTKDEYESLVIQIKKHMDDMPYINKKGITYKYGEFFPIEFSPFAYNETIAFEFFPLTKEQAIEENFLWRDIRDKNYIPTLTSINLHDDIMDVSDSIVNEIIECIDKAECGHLCTKAFKITIDELRFYRKMGLPLPRACPKCRTAKRLEQRTKFEELKKRCDCGGNKSKDNQYNNTIIHFHGENPCNEEFITNYTDNKEILYCEKCYQQEIN